MYLKDKLMVDLKSAMKNKEKLRKSVITMVRAAIKQYEVDNRTEIDDEKIVEIMSKQVKQKKDAIIDFQKGNRQDLVDEANNEIEVLLEYLPKQLTEDEIKRIVDETISDVNASGPKDMGKVMGAIMPKVKGRADGKIISRLVKESLS
jgi:uncharacterized protein YqeY